MTYEQRKFFEAGVEFGHAAAKRGQSVESACREADDLSRACELVKIGAGLKENESRS